MRGIVIAATRYLTGLLLAALLCAFAPVASAFEMPQWQSALERDHPLAGQILNTQGQGISPEKMIADMAKADFVILGETHDNRDHHAIQAEIIEAIAQAGAQPAIVFEMLPRPMQARLDAFLAGAVPDAAAFGDLVEWEKRGWPDWKTYQPILEAAIRHNLPVIAGNVAREQLGEIFASGTANMDEALSARYAFDRPLPEDSEQALVEALLEGHCGHMPEGQGERMQLVQRLRDGSMADAMIEAAKNGGKPIILIAGSGHARRDFGVPHVLSELASESRTISLALIEASKGDTVPEGYLPPADANGPYDYVLITPRAEREDPCERFLERIKSREDG